MNAQLAYDTTPVAEPAPDVLLRRLAAADALGRLGCPLSPCTLASMATRGGGPRFSKVGNKSLYRYSDLVAWLQERLAATRTDGGPSRRA